MIPTRSKASTSMQDEIKAIDSKYAARRAELMNEMNWRMEVELAIVEHEYAQKLSPIYSEMQRRMATELVQVEEKYDTMEAELLLEMYHRQHASGTVRMTSSKDCEARRTRLLDELYSSERAYVKDIETLKEVYYAPLLSNENIIPRAEVKRIFHNLLDIHAANNRLVMELRDLVDEPQDGGARVGQVLAKMADSMMCYASYCSQQDATNQLISALMTSNPAFSSFLSRAVSDPRCKKQDLSSFLILPVHRLGKYPSMVKDLIKCTPIDWTEEHAALTLALERFQCLVEKVSQSKRVVDNLRKLYEMRTSVTGMPFDIQIPGRQFVHQGLVSLHRRDKMPKPRFLMLFNDGLFVFKQGKPPATWRFCDSIPLLHLFVHNLPDLPSSAQSNPPFSFLVIHSCPSAVSPMPTSRVVQDICCKSLTMKRSNASSLLEAIKVDVYQLSTRSSDEKSEWMASLSSTMKAYLSGPVGKESFPAYEETSRWNSIARARGSPSPLSSSQSSPFPSSPSSRSKLSQFIGFIRSSSSSGFSVDKSPSSPSMPTASMSLKVCVLGPRSGKSAICERFTKGTFGGSISSKSPLEENHKRIVTTSFGTHVQLNILDTGSDAQVARMYPKWTQWAHGFLLVFDLNSIDSLNAVPSIRGKIDRVFGSSAGSLSSIVNARPVVLVGARSDIPEESRQVKRDAVQRMCQTLGCTYIETSAKTGQSVDEAFMTITQEIMQVQLLHKLDSSLGLLSKQKIVSAAAMDAFPPVLGNALSLIIDHLTRMVESNDPIHPPSAFRTPHDLKSTPEFHDDIFSGKALQEFVSKLDFFAATGLLKCLLNDATTPLVPSIPSRFVAKLFELPGMSESELKENVKLLLEGPLFAPRQRGILQSLVRYLNMHHRYYHRWSGIKLGNDDIPIVLDVGIVFAPLVFSTSAATGKEAPLHQAVYALNYLIENQE